MTLEQRIEELEKRVAALEEQIREQPNLEEIVNKIKETLKKQIDAASTIAY